MEDDEELTDSKTRLMSDDEAGQEMLSVKRARPWRMMAAGVAALLAYTAFVVFATRSLSAPRCHFSRNFPPPDAFTYDEGVLPTRMNSPFTGEPSPESDAAWHELVKNNAIRVPNSILRERGQRSIEIAGTDESISQLSVFHALHCLKKIRQLLHHDYYYPNATEWDDWFNGKHVDHCFEYVREYTMCHADTSLLDFLWINGTLGKGPLQPTSKDFSKHQCTNWESLDAWAGERSFDLFELEKLRYPDNGLEYSDKWD